MKKTLLIVGLGLALAAPAASGAGQAAADVSGASTIESVTIYQNRCMITRTMTGDVVPGPHTWEFRDLPAQLLEESVRVSGRGTAGARILDIRIQQALGSESSQAALKDLKKKRDDLAAQLLEIADRLDVLAKEADLVKAVSVLKPGDDKSAAAAGQAGNTTEWQRRLDFIDVQLPKILEQTRRLNAEKDALEMKRDAAQHDLDQQASLLVRQRKAVLVDVEVTRAGSEKLSLSYVVPGVTWSPSYDLRIDSQKDEATLTYQALVTQATGEDWNSVQLFLSTAEPALQSRPQRLEAWRVDTESGETGAISCFVADPEGTPLSGATVTVTGGAFRRSLTSDARGRVLFVNLKPGTYNLRAELQGFNSVLRDGIEVRPGRRASLDLALPLAALEEQISVAAKVSYNDLVAAEEAPVPEEEAAIETAEAADRTMATVFEIKQRQNVPSSREKKKVTIAVETLPVEKEFLTVPKLAETVSLNARITNAAEFLLLPGRASLFYDNDYISTAEVPFVAPNDRFALAVGDVPGVKVRWRQVSKTRTETGLVGKKVQLTYEIAITLENLTRAPRALLVKDQVPVTTSKDVTIDILQAVPEPVKTVLDEDEARTGILAWPVTLGPQEKKEITLKFRITHPKNRPLIEG
ncbi:MAG: mucoidy inhibitor MuiA family protein [Acidobacteriota bacterium]